MLGVEKFEFKYDLYKHLDSLQYLGIIDDNNNRFPIRKHSTFIDRATDAFVGRNL